jgi:hypothetical protein
LFACCPFVFVFFFSRKQEKQKKSSLHENRGDGKPKATPQRKGMAKKACDSCFSLPLDLFLRSRQKRLVPHSCIFCLKGTFLLALFFLNKTKEKKKFYVEKKKKSFSA